MMMQMLSTDAQLSLRLLCAKCANLFAKQLFTNHQLQNFKLVQLCSLYISRLCFPASSPSCPWYRAITSAALLLLDCDDSQFPNSQLKLPLELINSFWITTLIIWPFCIHHCGSALCHRSGLVTSSISLQRYLFGLTKRSRIELLAVWVSMDGCLIGWSIQERDTIWDNSHVLQLSTAWNFYWI